MPELMHFNIPGAFNEGYDRGTGLRQKSRLAELASQAYGAAPDQQRGFVQQAIANDPTTGLQLGQSLQGDQDARTKSLVNRARFLVNAPEAQRPALYASMVPELQQMGLSQLPPQYDESVEQTAQALVQAYMPQEQLAPRVVGDSLVNSRGEVLFKAQQKPQYQWDPNRGAWIPHPNNAAGADGAGDPTQAAMESDISLANDLVAAGMPEAQVEAFLAARGQRANNMAAGQPGGLSAIPVAGVGPKPQQAPSGYRYNPDGTLGMIPGGPAETAAQAREEAARARRAAEEAKANQKRQTELARQAAAVESAEHLIGAIDNLTQSGGFSELGTAWGDMKLSTPLVRSGVKDANAQLKNIAGQVALTTMASLKALSSQGATGFGALSAPELKLLENSISALNAEDISNVELARSLKTIKEKMQKIAAWRAEPTFDAPAPEDAPQSKAIPPPAAGGWGIQRVE